MTSPLGVARMVHEASGSPYEWDQLDRDKREEKERQAKRNLNSVAAKHMTQELLAEIDPEGDLLDWFREIRELLA